MSRIQTRLFVFLLLGSVLTSCSAHIGWMEDPIEDEMLIDEGAPKDREPLRIVILRNGSPKEEHVLVLDARRDPLILEIGSDRISTPCHAGKSETLSSAAEAQTATPPASAQE